MPCRGAMPDASKADCNSPGYKSKLACCDGQYGGQVSGACKVDFANPSTTTTKWYTNYGMSWGIAGCKAAFQYPSYVSTFYDNQPDCCKGAYKGQRSGACLAGLATPPVVDRQLQEHPPAADLRHHDLHQPAGVLQGCRWRTDEQHVHSGTTQPSH